MGLIIKSCNTTDNAAITSAGNTATSDASADQNATSSPSSQQHFTQRGSEMKLAYSEEDSDYVENDDDQECSRAASPVDAEHKIDAVVLEHIKEDLHCLNICNKIIMHGLQNSLR